MSQFQIIQGGMGVAVSGHALARTVSKLGQLGVVSGTALDVVLARSLQNGDHDGKLRHALSCFPIAEMADRVLERYFIEGGKPENTPYRPVPLHSQNSSSLAVELTVVASFVEVFLAKDGHAGKVGINLLEKIQTPTLPALYGALLADVDYVLMGAGIPRAIPGILDALTEGKPVVLRLDVQGAERGSTFECSFDPAAFFNGTPPTLVRPKFLAIISSATLAITLARKSTGQVDGFIVEMASAGGHNAPPRGNLRLSEHGEPIYGDRDQPELEKIKKLGLPFWLAGSFGQPGQLARARELGAAGIQVGTAFAFCEESGITPALKHRAIEMSRDNSLEIFTDPLASPTGFPFKVLQMEGSVSEPAVQESRERVCDLGYLRHSYRKPDGSVGYRCPGEPTDQYLKKGGDPQDTVGRKCVCNSLLATVGLGQVRPGGQKEPPLLTAGDEVSKISEFAAQGNRSYTAADVIDRLLA